MNDWILVIALAVAGLLLIGVLLFWMYRRSNPKKQKIQGKDNKTALAANMARSFARSNSFRFIEPVTLARNGMVAELDGIIIGYFGVLGVKALGYNGEIYGNPNDKEWVQVGEKGQRTYFPNPLTVAAADVRVIRDALFSAKLKLVPVEVVCVFTDKTAQLALPRSTGHYTLKAFKQLLGREKYLEDKGLDLDAVEKAVREAVVE